MFFSHPCYQWSLPQHEHNMWASLTFNSWHIHRKTCELYKVENLGLGDFSDFSRCKKSFNFLDLGYQKGIVMGILYNACLYTFNIVCTPSYSCKIVQTRLRYFSIWPCQFFASVSAKHTLNTCASMFSISTDPVTCF